VCGLLVKTITREWSKLWQNLCDKDYLLWLRTKGGGKSVRRSASQNGPIGANIMHGHEQQYIKIDMEVGLHQFWSMDLWSIIQ
jgi:hypothetical protein